MSLGTTDADRQALLLLCAPTSIGGGAAASFGPAAWSRLQDLLRDRRLSPGQLLGMSQEELEASLELSAEQADRVVRLLARGGPVAIEMERLGSRGIWITVLGDETYPPRLLAKLGEMAPPLLFGAGSAAVAAEVGLAIVGSRDADEEAITYSEMLAAAAVRGGLAIISGAARGVDAAAMTSGLEHGGSAVAVLADGLEKRIREPQIRTWLADDRLCLLSPYGSNTGFSVGAAMGRNKLIYGLSAFALVVAATAGRGGTWAGASEALKHRWATIFVREAADKRAKDSLVSLGAHPLPDLSADELTAEALANLAHPRDGGAHLMEPADDADAPMQATLFGSPEKLLPVSTRRVRKAASSRPRGSA